MSPAVSEFVDKKLDKISKLVQSDPSAICDLELARTTAHHHKGDIFKADIHIVGNGIDAYATAQHEDIYMAITDAKDEILRELKGTKGKRISIVRRSGARVKAMVKGIWPFS
ncbi:MAG: Ribosomal subunit interface protein [Candidatus Parcubacteria bacterium]|nr:Ribosomal subunit interface protein [Candidatus Parcubacteria bacterium]